MELVIKAGRAAMRHVDRILEDHGITFPQFEVITAIAAGDKLTMGEVADVISSHRSNVTSISDRLVRDGLVQRIRSEEDRRIVHMVLTELGLERYAATRMAIAPYLDQKVDERVAGFLADVILKAQEAADRAAGQ